MLLISTVFIIRSMLSDLALKNKKNQLTNGAQSSVKEGMFGVGISWYCAISDWFFKTRTNFVETEENFRRVFNLLVSSVSVEAYERRIKKLEREKSELSWKLQESTKVLQEQSIDTKSSGRSSDSGNLNEEVSTLKRKNNGKDS